MSGIIRNITTRFITNTKNYKNYKNYNNYNNSVQKCKIIEDDEKYETQQAQIFALRLGNYDEIAFRSNLENQTTIDEERIAKNPFCCGECGICSY
jgi:hypothetical protein